MPQIAAAFAAIGTAISSAAAAVSAFAAASVFGSFLVNVALSVGLSLLARALSPKPKIRQSGIQTDVTTTGGTTPQRFILGTYATAGHLVAPPYSHGSSGDTPNAYLNYVIEVSDFPGVALSKVIVNDDYSSLGGTPDADYGSPLLKFRVDTTDYAWVKFYNGTQVAADAMLVAKYASHPDRPWTSTAIGTDTAYAVMTFLYNRELFNSLPSVRFEITGIPLYDPRKDTTAGGSGAHRFNDQSTWEFSDNPAVMIYNIMRGIVLPDGSIYGGETAAADLPYSNWAAAMNVCDTLIGSRKAYRAGLEVDVTASPADVIDELLKVCHGQISEYGGVFRIRCGAPGASVLSITDDSIIITDEQQFTPFPGLEETYNAITGSYPEPNSLWEAREAPPIYNATWETEDGGRRLPIEMTFPACPYIAQVEQLMNGYIEDNRRFRTHRIVLPPNAAILEPLDTISWTSARNGYTTKIFEVIELVDRPLTMLQEVYVRERDAADYNWTSGQDPAQPSLNTGLTPPGAQLVQGLTVTALTLKDGLGLDRRPAIRIAWTGTAALDAEFVQVEIRLKASAAVVFYGVFSAREGFAIVSDGILPSTVYEVRIRYVMDRPADWSSWVEVTTGAIFITDADFQNGIKTLFQNAGLSAPEIVSSLPSTGNFQGRLVFLTTDNKLYRWTGTAWTAAVPTVDLTGTISEAQIAANAVTVTKIANAAVEAAKLATNAVTADKIEALAVTQAKVAANAITAAKIANAAVEEAKLATGAATEAKIATNAITETKISSNAVTAAKINAGAITAGKIAAGAVQAGNIAAGAIVANDIAAGTITGNKIATDTITATNIAAGAITASELNTGAVTAGKIAAGAVQAGNIAAGAIVAADIAAGTITADKIATNTITATQIAAGTITATQIASSTITATQIAGNTITGNKIVANTITGGLLATSGLITQVAQIGDGLITNAKIENATIQTAKIANNAITFPSFIEGTAAADLSRTGGAETTIASLTITQTGAPVWIFAEATITHTTGGSIQSNKYIRADFRIRAAGTQIDGISGVLVAGLNSPTFAQDTTHTATGSVTYTFTAQPTGGDADNLRVVGASLFIIELKK